MVWSARAALLFTLLLALGARAAPAGEPDRDRRGVTLRADLHPGLLVFGPAAAVVMAREEEEEGLAGVPLVGRRRDAAMAGRTSDEPKGVAAEDDERRQDPSDGGDAPRDDDTPEDDLVQPKAHPSRRGIVGIVFLTLYVQHLASLIPFPPRSLVLSAVIISTRSPPLFPTTLLLTLFLAAYPPARRRTAVYAQKTAAYTHVVWGRICSTPVGSRIHLLAGSSVHLPSALRTIASHIHLPFAVPHPSYHRIGEKVGSLFPTKLSRTSESKLVRWAEEDMGLDAAQGHLALDDLESDHFLNEDVADEDLELADGEYIPLRAAKGRARVYGTVGEGERKAAGRRWWR
ncbi:hypothetical protein FB107DRAFT_293218 [Schizophyllum commune]